MSALTLDTLKYAKRLKAAGVAPEQAEAQAEALAEVCEAGGAELVTRADLKEQITVLRSELQEQLTGMRGEMQENATSLRAEMKETTASLRFDLRELELRMDARFAEVDSRFQLLHWMLGLLLGGVTALVLKTFF